MEKLEHYREVIKRILREHSQHRPSCGQVEVELIFDEPQDHYELIFSGWNGPYRIHGSVLHVDIRQDKVWIQFDGTEDSIAEDLVAAGIPREHIVLAYKPPDIRPHTGFAVA